MGKQIAFSISEEESICERIDEYEDLYSVIAEGIDSTIEGIAAHLYFTHYVGVNEVARQLEVSKTYISKCFHREFKMSFHVYKKLIKYHCKLHNRTLEYR